LEALGPLAGDGARADRFVARAKPSWKSLASMACLALLLDLTPSSLFAQESPQKSLRSGSRDLLRGAKDTTAVNEQRLKIFMEKIEILGRIEKPQAVYIVPGTDPKVEDFQINRSFFNEIFRSIDKDSFVKQIGERGRDPLLW